MVHQQSDYLAAVGVVLSTEPDAQDAVYTLLRAALEFGTRAMWLLAPDENSEDKKDEPEGKKHRVRCARYWLTELVSQNEKTMGLKVATVTPGTTSPSSESKKKLQELKEQARTWFGDANVLFADPDDPSKNDISRWSIDGQPYARWTDIARQVYTLVNLAPNGDDVYNFLALRAHPQGFRGTFGLQPGPEGSLVRVVDTEMMQWAIRNVVACFYKTLATLATYYGYESDLLTQVEDRIVAAFPGFFGDDNATPV